MTRLLSAMKNDVTVQVRKIGNASTAGSYGWFGALPVPVRSSSVPGGLQQSAASSFPTMQSSILWTNLQDVKIFQFVHQFLIQFLNARFALHLLFEQNIFDKQASLLENPADTDLHLIQDVANLVFSWSESLAIA